MVKTVEDSFCGELPTPRRKCTCVPFRSLGDIETTEDDKRIMWFGEEREGRGGRNRLTDNHLDVELQYVTFTCRPGGVLVAINNVCSGIPQNGGKSKLRVIRRYLRLHGVMNWT